MTTPMTSPTWLLDPRAATALPSVPADVEYHRALAGESRRLGRGILALVLLVMGMVVFPTVIGHALGAIDRQLGNTPPILGGTDYTWIAHAGSMVSLALLMPWSMLIQRVLYGVPGASLHSVGSRFRFDLLGKALVVVGPAWVLVTMIGFLAPADQVPWSQADLIGIFVATLLLTPLQASGEEYGVRGLMFRVVSSWFRSSRAGLIAGVLISSALFTALHGSTDLYITIWYVVLWSCLALITWRTGGLEIAVVLHAILNTVAFLGAPLLRIDFGAALSDRSSGAGSITQLIPAAAVLILTAIIWWSTRKAGPARTPDHDCHSD